MNTLEEYFVNARTLISLIQSLFYVKRYCVEFNISRYILKLRID